MKKISFWASSHYKTARFLLVLVKTLLAALAYYTGMALYNMQVILPANTIYTFCFLALIVIVAVYPSFKNNTLSKKLNYLRQKACDFSLGLCSFLTIASAVNNGDLVRTYSGAYGTVVIKHKPTAEEILASGRTRGELTRKEKRILKKEFYKQLKIYAAAKLTGDKQKSGEAWKIVLAIIVAIGLMALLAALACNLSCNGSAAAAVIVGVLGVVGIIWGLSVIIKRINRGSPKTGKE